MLFSELDELWRICYHLDCILKLIPFCQSKATQLQQKRTIWILKIKLRTTMFSPLRRSTFFSMLLFVWIFLFVCFSICFSESPMCHQNGHNLMTLVKILVAYAVQHCSLIGSETHCYEIVCRTSPLESEALNSSAVLQSVSLCHDFHLCKMERMRLLFQYQGKKKQIFFNALSPIENTFMQLLRFPNYRICSFLKRIHT